MSGFEYIENKIRILNTEGSSITSANYSSGAFIVDGGGIIAQNLVIGEGLKVEGTTASFGDNFLLINEDPIDSSDAGIVFERFNSDTTSGSSKQYASIYFSEQDDRFCFAYLNSDPERGYVAIDNLSALCAYEIELGSTTNALGIGSGGSLTVLGGGSISKDLFVGDSLFVNSDIVSDVLISSFSTIDNLNVSNLTSECSVLTKFTSQNAYIDTLSVGTLVGVTMDMDSLQSFYTESLFKSSTTCTNYIEKINSTSTSLMSSTFLIKLSYEIDTSQFFGNYDIRFTLNGNVEFVESGSTLRNTDSENKQWFTVKTLPTGFQTILLEFRKKQGFNGTVSISDAKVLLLEISPLSYDFVEQIGMLSTTCTNFVNVINILSFLPLSNTFLSLLMSMT